MNYSTEITLRSTITALMDKRVSIDVNSKELNSVWP